MARERKHVLGQAAEQSLLVLGPGRRRLSQPIFHLRPVGAVPGGAVAERGETLDEKVDGTVPEPPHGFGLELERVVRVRAHSVSSFCAIWKKSSKGSNGTPRSVR